MAPTNNCTLLFGIGLITAWKANWSDCCCVFDRCFQNQNSNITVQCLHCKVFVLHNQFYSMVLNSGLASTIFKVVSIRFGPFYLFDFFAIRIIFDGITALSADAVICSITAAGIIINRCNFLLLYWGWGRGCNLLNWLNWVWLRT